jgi:Pvc16 N-terminal domain
VINDILTYLKDNLNAYLTLGRRPEDPQEDQVVFPEGQNGDSLSLKPGAVSLVLVRLEQENILRPPDPYVRRLPEGTLQMVQPEIRLNLYTLFVAHYPQYKDALRNLSGIIQYFQSNRVINHNNSPDLSQNVDQLVIELVTLSFSEQNEIWGALRLPYHPSVLYRVKMIVFYDNEARAAAPAVEERVIRFSA